MGDIIRITIETDNELKQADRFAIEEAVGEALEKLELDLTILSIRVSIQ